MAGKLLLNFLLGSSLCVAMASAQIPTAGSPMAIANTAYYRAANSYSSLTFKIPNCLQTIDQNVDQIMIVARKNTEAPVPEITTDTSFPAGVYVVDKFAVPPCNLGSNMDSVYRLGANAKSLPTCVSVPQPPTVITECNPPLANGTQYRVNAILYVGQLAVKQLGWSDSASTISTRMSRDDIPLPPGGRSGGMIVITVILTVLMALLIVILVGAILSSRK
ncbi:uroplakin-3a-like [Lethenteron reissneri]|uniref:uroplakin-3a-like n=1 Tax=Lethenteron reissneri TaxID=7753 RepID=UPI002AB7091F|nr:uroplakin-3a-like [Lethenteron reissneri]